MKEENLKALRERIQASFDEARGQEPHPTRKIDEEERVAKTVCGFVIR
jgi:hypothetical protein